MWKFQTLSVHCCWCLCFVPLLNACLLGPPAAAMPSRTHMSINAFPEMTDILVDQVIYCSAAVSVTSALTFCRSHSKHTFMTIWRWGTSLYCFVVFVSWKIDWCSLYWNKKSETFRSDPSTFVSLPHLQDGSRKAGKTGMTQTHFLFLPPPTCTPAHKKKDGTKVCHHILWNLGCNDAKKKKKHDVFGYIASCDAAPQFPVTIRETSLSYQFTFTR